MRVLCCSVHADVSVAVCHFPPFFLHSMTLERYEVVPPNIQQEIVAKNKVAA